METIYSKHHTCLNGKIIKELDHYSLPPRPLFLRKNQVKNIEFSLYEDYFSLGEISYILEDLTPHLSFNFETPFPFLNSLLKKDLKKI